MVCGDFKESANREINLDDVPEPVFLELLWLACGKDGQLANTCKTCFDIAILAERLQMTAVVTLMEDILLKELKAGSCIDMLQRSEVGGLERLRRACEKMFKFEFKEVSRTEGFVQLHEETLNELLEGDELCVLREEDTLEAVLSWIERAGGGLRGKELLKKIRYGAMDETILAGIASSQSQHTLLRELVWEALTRKGVKYMGQAWDGVERLCDKWMVVRKAPLPRVKLAAGTCFGSDALDNPACVALTQEGSILVSDNGLNQVIVFNCDGTVATRLGSAGAAPGQFKSPNGVAVDRQGRILVADNGNHRVQVLNPDGSVVRCLGSEGCGPGELKHPSGVAVDGEGRIVVAEWGNNRIQVFNADGSVARLFGSKGAAVGQLNGPAGVAVDGGGRIVVADWFNQRVQVFNPDGSVALCFGSAGVGPGQFSRPRGVAVDREGRFVVSDYDNRRIQVFDSDGSVAGVVGAAGSAAGELRFPFGVAADGAGRIVVVEVGGTGNRRVQVL